MNWIAWLPALACAVLLALELLLRVLGFRAFPLFQRDERSNYRMRGNQQGRFRWRYNWVYNAQGMRTDRPFAASDESVILLGDSIVDGGLGISQPQTLASRIGCHAFPLACHGWALRNELAALASLPGWEQCGAVVWVLNPGDFDTVGQGESQLSFPERRPALLGPWLLRRTLLRNHGNTFERRRKGQTAPAPSGLRQANLDYMRDLLAGFHGIVLIVRYPARNIAGHDDPYWQALAQVHPRASLVDVAGTPGWDESCYSDPLHPSAHGTELLARVITGHLSALARTG